MTDKYPRQTIRGQLGARSQRLFERYPIRWSLTLAGIAGLLLVLTYQVYFYAIRFGGEFCGPLLLIAVVAGAAVGILVFLLAVVGLVMGTVEILFYLLRPPAKLCPRCGAVHTDAERQAKPLDSGAVWLHCPTCGKEWKQARFRW